MVVTPMAKTNLSGGCRKHLILGTDPSVKNKSTMKILVR
jgi:hypothetical protein